MFNFNESYKSKVAIKVINMSVSNKKKNETSTYLNQNIFIFINKAW